MAHYMDYAEYPTVETWHKLYDRKKKAFDKLFLFQKEGQEMYSLNSSESIRAMNLSFWISEHNNKAFDLINNFILLKHYYDKGIPDKEWWIEDNGMYKFFPHMEEKHEGHKYWFDFYMDSYYKRFATFIDTICHLINLKYGFQIPQAPGFRQNVMEQLQSADKTLFKDLKKFWKNKAYKKAERFRNDLTHNYRPNIIDSGITERREEDKVTISGNLGSYTTTAEFITNIEATIDLMVEIVDTIRFKILRTEVAR